MPLSASRATILHELDIPSPLSNAFSDQPDGYNPANQKADTWSLVATVVLTGGAILATPGLTHAGRGSM
jgi:hypothetical protein